MYDYVAASSLLTDTHFAEAFWAPYDDGQNRVYAITAVDGSGRESGFGQLTSAPGIFSPVAVAIDPVGARVVLDNWNPYPLLRQQPDGRYTQRLVSPHYDMIFARSLTYDGIGRLPVSGLGEFPGGRRAVRACDQDMQPLWAFGEEGLASLGGTLLRG
jgi:hypothetical protein